LEGDLNTSGVDGGPWLSSPTLEGIIAAGRAFADPVLTLEELEDLAVEGW
jgi:hypothetical protein